MEIIKTPIDDVVVVKTKPFADERGMFYRAFCDRQLESVLNGHSIRQINLSRTEAVGAIRGLHFQYPPHAEMKLVRCLKGKVWDVALDLRQGSPTFLQWYGVELSPENNQMLVISQGCAHGFQVLTPGSELLYLHTEYYEPEAEGGVRHDDSKINVSWPLAVTDLSQRDRSHPLLTDNFQGIKL
jgi:dTDP-4-dehydrorhamnose 3,5-epimerase